MLNTANPFFFLLQLVDKIGDGLWESNNQGVSLLFCFPPAVLWRALPCRLHLLLCFRGCRARSTWHAQLALRPWVPLCLCAEAFQAHGFGQGRVTATYV